ncbi:sensor domain-containing diguanylate cyclase [Leptospira ilyithenensis]|uniref:diguanylate cyclase n=1 Tax=Leptospira ilyithenensis TaxID=2484901 RepID=A0A4R9LRA1_9LEPT|nr:sensor domain-containing diguanylate cyclase [Leptospira ilyithenensis]TGN10902.1 sensor domain-containing diguanylate cyclase [Leptospira ilyithenensis]
MSEFLVADISQKIVEHSIDAIIVLDSENKINLVNPALEVLSGFHFDELKDKSLDYLFPKETYPEENKTAQITNYISKEESHYATGHLRELELNTKLGASIPVEIRAFEISPATDGTKLFATIIRDIRERKRMEDQRTLLINSLKLLAYMDELTLLPNRRSFYDSVQKTIAIVKRRSRDSVLAVMDIDLFKTINDSYGHDIGDMVLKGISKIFTDCLREEDTIGRIGGEEFGCILPDTDVESAALVLDRIRESVKAHRFFIFDNFYLNVTISMGYTKVHPSQQAEEIIKFADIALYQAKNSGRDRIQVYPV